MREFIALKLTDEVHAQLANLQDKLKQSNADVKWVQANNIHLTLKFLSEVDEKKTSEIKKILDKIASQNLKFEMTLGEIGAFPKIDYPRVIWVGIDEGKEQAKKLAEQIDTELEKLGFQKEDRPFTAHLTLGRVRSSKNKEQLVALLKSTMSAPGADSGLKIPVTEITLFQSTLTPKGAIYTALHAAGLKPQT